MPVASMPADNARRFLAIHRLYWMRPQIETPPTAIMVSTMRVLKHRPPLNFSVAVVLLLGAKAVFSAPPLHQQIDQLIEAKAGDSVTELADDAEFLRRASLDFNGIIPTADETQKFLADKNPQKRENRINRLLADAKYARRMREAFTVMLLERRTGANVSDEDWNAFLEMSFAANKPWNQFVRELFQANATDEKLRGSVKFFVDGGRGDHHQMTQDVARLFLGMNIHCAKCHDHPTVAEYTQADYYGLLSYLSQSKLQKNSATQASHLVETVAKDKLEFASVFVPEDKQKTGPRLPKGAEIEIPAFENDQQFAEPPKDGLPGVPKFRPRLLLSDHLTAATNKRFVRNSVNRFWFLMMGRGLVHPLDMLHRDNPPSHPKLLDVLAREFVAHKFDVKWLLREIATSRAYQRSSLLPEGVNPKDAPPQSYQVANGKGLSPEQMMWSFLRATGHLDKLMKRPKAEDSKFTYKDYINRRIPPPDNLHDTMTLFTNVFGNPSGEAEVVFQPSMGQSLFLMNEPLLLSWLKPQNDNLIDRLAKQKDSSLVAEQLYLGILSRQPDKEEKTFVAEHLEQNAARRTEAISQFAWALLSSAEFRLNH